MLEVIAFINSCMRVLEVSQAGAELTSQHGSCLQTALASLLLSKGSPGMLCPAATRLLLLGAPGCFAPHCSPTPTVHFCTPL